MRIDSGEVELAGEQEDHHSDGLKVSIATRPPLGRLEKVIKGLQETIGLPCSRPRDDAIEMFPNHASELLHGLDLGTHHVRAPLPQHPRHHVDQLALQDFPQLLPIRPGACRAPAGHLGQEGINFGPLLLGQAVVVPQQLPTQSLEVRRLPLFQPPHCTQRPGGLGNDMELVEGDSGIRQMGLAALDEGRRHVDTDRLDLLRIASMGAQFHRQTLDGGGSVNFMQNSVRDFEGFRAPRGANMSFNFPAMFKRVFPCLWAIVLTMVCGIGNAVSASFSRDVIESASDDIVPVSGWSSFVPTPADTRTYPLRDLRQPGSRLFYISTSDGNDATAMIYFWDGKYIIDEHGSRYDASKKLYGTDPLNPTGRIRPFRSWAHVAPRNDGSDIGTRWKGDSTSTPGAINAATRQGYPDWWLFKRGDRFGSAPILL